MAGRLAIIGAGPYGLAAAAHLCSAGLDVTVIGEPMSFWEQHMPRGMLLRSARRASSISDPDRALTLDAYERARGAPLGSPVPLDEFVAYARWFQEQVVPDLDPRRVASVERGDTGFLLTFEDGDPLGVDRVVVAGGIARFARPVAELSGVPETLVSHASTIRDPARFDGLDVVVVGAGQSALETAALLHEAGAQVEVVARTPTLRWLAEDARPEDPRRRRYAQRVLHPPTGVGPPGPNWIAAFPDVFRRMPAALKPEIDRVCIAPMGSAWLRARLEGVRLTTGRRIAAASADDGRLDLTLDDGSRRSVDHVVLGTGYQVDVAKYDFLGPLLLREIRAASGYPVLGTGFESSVAGLHFVGASAAWSFGPVMRFVVGTWYAAPALTRYVTGKRPLVARAAW